MTKVVYQVGNKQFPTYKKALQEKATTGKGIKTIYIPIGDNRVLNWR